MITKTSHHRLGNLKEHTSRVQDAKACPKERPDALLRGPKSELTHSKRPWCWEGSRAGGEGDDRGWDGWMASPTRWTWVWVNSGSWWWTGRPGVLWFTGSQRVRHDWASELNWTELNWRVGSYSVVSPWDGALETACNPSEGEWFQGQTHMAELLGLRAIRTYNQNSSSWIAKGSKLSPRWWAAS